MSTSRKRWNRFMSIVLAAAMIGATLTPTAAFAQPEEEQAQVMDVSGEVTEAPDEGAAEAVDVQEQEEAVDVQEQEEAVEAPAEAEGDKPAGGADGSGSTDPADKPGEGRKSTDMDSFTEALETDFSQAAQLPLTGYFFKKIGDSGRQAKIYISEHASIRSYFTVIAVPDGVDTDTFVEEQGWFDVADKNGECLLILEPGDGNAWKGAGDEIDYITAAINFVKTGRNANNIALFSNFGEFYLVGYGKAANALQHYAMLNPIFVISQYYTDASAINTALMNEAGAVEYDGSNSSGYSAGYKDKDEEFNAVLKGLGYDSRLKNADIPIPTWLNNYSANGATAKYWKKAIDVYGTAVDGVYWQKPESTRLSTLYANACQREDGKNYGIAQLKITSGNVAPAEDIYGFLSLYTRYDNTFAYSNALSWRLNYAPATVAAQIKAKGSSGTAYKYMMTGGEEGNALFLGDGDIAVKVPGSDAGGTVNVGVIAFADNGGTKDFDPREFIVYIPDTAKAWGKKGAPVIMVYPGNSQTDRIFMDSTAWWRVANKEGAVVAIVCETYNRGGVSVSHYNSDLFYYALKAHLDQYISKLYGVNLDMGRIYGTGQSAGSMTTQGFAFTHPEFFAAVASTSGIRTGGGKSISIPSYLITGYSDLNNLVPDIQGSEGLQAWADYLIKVNGAGGSALKAGKEYSESPYETMPGKDLLRWNTEEWSNDQGIVLVKWSQNILRSHNCYPAEMPMLFEFMKHFRYETDAKGNVTGRFYSKSGFTADDEVRISYPELPYSDSIESIQAITDETFYGTGVVQVVVTYKDGTDLSNVTADTYVLEDRGTLSPDFGRVRIDSIVKDGLKVTLNIYSGSQATGNNKLVYTGSNKEGSRERNVFGIYSVGPWYRDAEGTIHYGKSDEDEYENNTTGQGYQSRACLELKLRHVTDEPVDAACLADEKGQFISSGSLWLPTIDRQFGKDGFQNLYDLKIPSTGKDDETGIGDPYVRGYYFIPKDYDPADGIVFTLQGQGISYWQLPDGTNDAGTGFMYDSATYSWRNKGAIVVNIHDRSTTSKLPEGYDFVVDDVNVMKYFIDKYNVTGNIVIQGNSRGTMASDIVIKALAGCKYDPAQQGMGAKAELNKQLDKKTYDFTIDTYICQNGTMGGNMWEDDAWTAIVATGLRVWAFDGEQDSNNIENIAKLKDLYKKAGKSDEWIDENVRLTGYTSKLYYPWGESDHSTTRINGWYFSDAAYYGPDLTVDPATGELTYNTKLKDGQTYKLEGTGSAGENNKKDYEYTVYDDLFQEWALERPDEPQAIKPSMSDIESIQAFTDETFYGMGVVEVVVTYKKGVDISGVKAKDYILEDRGSLNPDFGQIKIADVKIDGQKATLVISQESQATENNKLVYTGSKKEGSRERNAFGVYATNAWYRDAAGVIHYGKDDKDAYEDNTTGQGYQTRACLELKLRHAGEKPEDAACLADEKGQYVGKDHLWLPTVDREYTVGGFKNLYDLKIPSTGQYDTTGIGDKFVRGTYFVPEKYDPANGIVFTIQGQGISYWQLEDGTNDAGTGFTYDSATYSWRNKGAIVVNIHDRSTTSKLPEGYDFVVDDVNVMKHFIDTYKVTGNIVIQGNSRGTMASDIIIKALAGCMYNPAQQGMGATAELNKRLDKKTYDFTIDTYICQNGTMGGNLWEDDAWKAVVDTGLKVWAFDGEQDTNNIDNIARYIKLCKEAGYSDEWIEENVRLTGYTSKLYYPWGESDHSTTRINGWYFADAAYYGPDLSIDPDTGKIVYKTKLADGAKYKLEGYGSAGENNKKDYEYTVYDDLFQVWALEPAGDPIVVVDPVPTELEEFVSRLYKNFLGREPDERGLADWVNALESGRATGAKVVSGFVLSQEFQNNPLDNEDYVTALYRIIFNREPDAQGLANWIAVLENGCTKKRVLAGFVNSDEFKALCKKLGVEPGHYDSDELPDLYPKVAGFVARLYKICLGRMYDQAGLNAWVTVLVTKEASGSKVARNFFHSKEFYNRDLGNGAFVRVAYQTLLDRDPEAAGFENWTNALEHGLSRDDVIEGFLDSKEFGNICQYYDIVR